MKYPIENFLIAQAESIIEEFEKKHQHKDCIKIDNSNIGLGTNLYIEGSRKNKVLLVAHLDTVWDYGNPEDLEIQITRHKDLLFSKTIFGAIITDEDGEEESIEGIGIGADDRAGVAALYELSDLGHSILLTDLEEIGCLGSCALMADPEISERLNDHQFMIQLDRKGKNDAVYYNVGTHEFKKFVNETIGYKEQAGSSSDISVLCEKICGVNLSIGYKNEHTPREILNLRHWSNTVESVRKLLTLENLPKFVL